jgi:PilZ domain
VLPEHSRGARRTLVLLPPYPILVVAYTEETRAALVATLTNNGAVAAPCATFCEAENLALRGCYSGLLVDLPSIIKSKGEEKIVAYTLANFFPTLRVRAMGSMLIPMAMPGSAKQDKNLGDFLSVTCPAFTSRTLRVFRRHQVCISTLVQCNGKEFRGFTLDISWGGAFIVDVFSERFAGESEVIVSFLDCGFSIPSSIRWLKPWGMRSAPGIGVSFNSLDNTVIPVFSEILKTSREFDRDRLTA